MIRKILTLTCLAAFVASMAACGGTSTEVKLGDPKKMDDHKTKAMEDPDGTMGVSNDT